MYKQTFEVLFVNDFSNLINKRLERVQIAILLTSHVVIYNESQTISLKICFIFIPGMKRSRMFTSSE